MLGLLSIKEKKTAICQTEHFAFHHENLNIKDAWSMSLMLIWKILAYHPMWEDVVFWRLQAKQAVDSAPQHTMGGHYYLATV